MDKEEFENNIRKTLKGTGTPSRASLMYVLRKIDENVTDEASMRYNNKTETSNIIINKLTAVFDIWKSKRLILIPSLIVLLFVGAFSLSPRNAKNNLSLSELVEQDSQLDESGLDYDDQTILTSIDEPSINDLSTIQNEI
jgi:hypothetical protein